MANRTICCLSLSMTLGILYGRAGQQWFVLLFVLLQCCMGAGIFRLQKGKIFLARLLCCLCVFGIGALHVQAQQAVRRNLEENLLPGQEITVRGRVFKIEEKQQQFIYYLTDTQVYSEGAVSPSSGILIYSSNGQYQPGNILKVLGRYEPFQISRNEGNFNEKQFQQSRNWEFRVYEESIVPLSKKEDRYRIILKEIQQRVREVFQNSMEEEQAGVMANLALGDKSLLEKEIKELYQRAGISHILAISGLHVSLLGMGVFKLLKLLGCPCRAGTLVAMGIVLSFGMLTGMEVSTGRAVGMFLLFMAAQFLGYSYDSLTALAAVAMVQLWENPFLMENTGFLFSYLAVLGVSLVYRICQSTKGEEKAGEKNCFGRLGKAVSKIRDTMMVSLCIQLTVLPLSLYYYYEMSNYSIFVNACVLPFLGVLLFLGVFGGISGSFFPLLGKAVLKPAGWILGMNQGICRIFLSFPASEYITGRPKPGLIAVYYSLLVLCLVLVWVRKERRWYAGIGIALFCLIFIRQKPQFEINVLDVGQGDGTFIQTESGEHFFVDGGSSDVKKLGTYRILPFLKCRGIRSVKGWIVSHADSDHISGFKEILQQGYPVEYLILADGMVRDEAAEELEILAKEAGCRILYVKPGMEFGTKDTKFTVLAPDSGTKLSENSEADRNAASLAVAVRHGTFTGIFTGDMGIEQEQKLLEQDFRKQYGISSVDFYKAAHHGSNGSNSEEFMSALAPKMTVISCGKNNSYGHPGTEAVERIEASGSRIFYTMRQGQIRVRAKSGAVQVWTVLPSIVYDRRKDSG